MQDSNSTRATSIEKDLKTYASYGVTTVLSMGTDQDTIFPVRNDQRAAAPAKLRRTSAWTPSMARVYTAGQGLMLKGGYGGLAGVNDAGGEPRSRPTAGGQRAARQGRGLHQALARLRARDDAEDAAGR